VWLALTAWLVAAACAGVAVRHWRKLSTLADDAESLLAECRRAQRSSREWLELLQVPDAANSVAAFNERVAEVARDLAIGAEVPRAAARIGLFSGAVLGVIELSRTLVSPKSAAVGAALAALGAGLAAAGVGYELDRRSRHAAVRGRQAWNALGSMLGQKRENAPPAAKFPE
jgi:hypothetical protein